MVSYVNRRFVLKGAGGVTVFLPYLGSWLWSNKLRAAENKPLPRFAMIFSGHGQFSEHWLPDPNKVNWEQDSMYERYVSLSRIAGDISPIIGKDFDPLRAKITLMSRIDYASDRPNHNCEALLLGDTLSSGQGRDSMDHVMAQALFGSSPLNLAVNSPYSSSQDKHHISTKNGRAVVGVSNPAKAFDNLFNLGNTAAAVEVQNNSGQPTPAQNNLKAIDLVREQYLSLRNSSKLSQVDKLKLEEHVAFISELQGKLKGSEPTKGGSGGGQGVPKSMCKNPKSPGPAPLNTGRSEDYGIVLDQSMEVMRLGLVCGVAPVATVMLHAYDYFNGTLGFLGLKSVFHESIGHGEAKGEKLILQRYYAKKVAEFMRALDQVEDTVGGSTVLDNSLVAWMNDLGSSANSPNDHARANLPILIGGKAGGKWKSGKFVDYGRNYGQGKRIHSAGGFYQGRPVNQLLLTMLQSLGVRPDQYETQPGAGFGVYGSKSESMQQNSARNHKTEKLPIVS
ncbi:MAG: DUF1552 domain-containing protein [Zetaproteobacteria bacterium]|nr:DUF1552 domain-containing protein [Zetaproteobacteria bacterium]